jgi:glutathione reductase (NADPH)
MQDELDLLVIGAGNAGLGAAGRAKEAGMRVAVVERRDVGGTCPLRGCVPKKVLVAAAEALEAARRAGEHGVVVGPATLDWRALMARKEGFVEGVSEDFERSLARRDITLLRGEARFVAADAVRVGEQTVRAKRFVVATGSRPRALGVPGEALTITSEEFLRLPERPARAVFIGGGVISLEFAHVLARAGTEVTVLELGERFLPQHDEALVQALVEVGASVGITHVPQARTLEVARAGDARVVRAEVAGSPREFVADVVVNAVGRVADLDALDLPAAEIPLERGRPEVSAVMRAVRNPRVWFAGDALPGTPQLSPVATLEGRAVVDFMLDEASARPLPYGAIPSCVYTLPNLATVGETEASARARGLDAELRANDMGAWRSSRTYAERAAMARVVVERGTDRILGASMLGHGAAEVIHVFAMAMAHGVTAGALRATTFAYPTFGADIKYML